MPYVIGALFAIAFVSLAWGILYMLDWLHGNL